MNVSRRAILATPLVLAIGAGVWYALRPSDESRIAAQLKALSKAVRVTEADMQANPIGRLAHVSGALEPIFDDDVRVSVPELTTLGSGRRELAQLVTAAPRYVRTFEVEFNALDMKIDHDAGTALVGATADVTALDRDSRTRRDKRAVDFRFARIDGLNGDWRITTVTVWPKTDASPQ